MSSSLKQLWLWICLGLGVGTVAALIQEWRFVGANRYAAYGLEFLRWEAMAEGAVSGAVQGALVGVGLWLVIVLVLGFLGQRFTGWLSEAVLSWEVLDRRRWIALCATVPLFLITLIFGLRILNEYFIPWDYTRRYWVLNGGWWLGSILSAFVFFQLLRLPVWDGTTGRRFRVAATALASVAVLVCAGLTLAARSAGSTSEARNILLITVDTQRADHLSCYGYGRETSPKLDALARSGILFENGFSHAPVTSSSFSCIHTGLRPRETGTYGNDPVRLAMPTLAEQLRNAGYETGAVVSNFVLQRGKNYEVGFDHFDDRMDSRERVRRTPERIGESTAEAALQWLRSRSGEERPVFLWVHFQDPHGPYTSPREYQDDFLSGEQTGRKLRINDSVKGQGGIPSYQELAGKTEYGYYVSQYDAEIRYFDDSMATLVDGLREMGLWDSSLVFFTSDHGEGMGEHDYYFAHGDYLWPGQTHVPFILWDPDNPGLDRRVSDVVQSSDIVPTVLSFAGLEPVIDLPGLDLRTVTESGEADRLVLSETFVTDNYKAAIRSRDLMVFYDNFNEDFRAYDPGPGRFLGPVEMFDHADFERLKAELDRLGTEVRVVIRGEVPGAVRRSRF